MALLAIVATNVCLYGQALRSKQGTNGKWGFVNKSTGEVVIPFIYDRVSYFSDTEDWPTIVEINGKSGYINKTGKVVIPLKYDQLFGFSEGLAPAKLNGKWGYIDYEDNVVIPFIYDFVGAFFLKSDPAWGTKAIAGVKLKRKWGYIDNTGSVVVPIEYSYSKLTDISNSRHFR